MARTLIAALLGAVSIVFLAAPGASVKPGPDAALLLPAIATDAVVSEAPRECSTSKGIVTACTYL